MAAGVGMNLLAALLLFTILAWIGMPQLISNQYTVKGDTRIIKNEVLVGEVLPDSPAARAGLQPRDDMISIGLPGKQARQISNADTLPKLTKEYAGNRVMLTYLRGGQLHSSTVRLLSTKEV